MCLVRQNHQLLLLKHKQWLKVSLLQRKWATQNCVPKKNEKSQLTFKKALVWWSAWGLYKVHSRMAAIWGEDHIAQSTRWKWYSIENLKKTHLKKEYDDQENPVSSEEYARFLKGSTVAEDRDDQDESANCNQDVCCLLYHCRLHKILGWRS